MKYTLLIACILSCFSLQALGKDHIVDQKNKKFSVDQITIKKGDSITFSNSDPFFHHIFSLVGDNLFDIGFFPQNKSRSKQFDVPGESIIECAIHPAMYLKVIIE